MCTLDVSRICNPSSSTKGRIVKDRSVESDQSFSDAIFDVLKVACPQLIYGKAMIASGYYDAAMCRKWAYSSFISRDMIVKGRGYHR